MAAVKHIDEAKLESDLGYRFQYLTEFIGLDAEDIKTIIGAAPLVAPLVPSLVNAVYDKLFGYDATKRHFMIRQHGYQGELPSDLASLGHDHPMIQFRKEHLSKYLAKLVTGPYDANMVSYLDLVGKIHTPGFGNKDINIPLVQMNALMGFVSDALIATIQGMDIPQAAKNQAVRSFTKLLWVQNDLITRHYAK